MDTRGYEKNKRIPAQWIPDGYGYGYGADIYPAGRVRRSYYPYPTRPVDIPTCSLSFCINLVQIFVKSKQFFPLQIET